MLPESGLSRRERQVMEIVHRVGRATAEEIREALDDPPSNAAVRSTLRILVEKKHLVREAEGLRYVYSPSVPASTARRSAVRQLLSTFFDGSTEGAMAALLEAGEPLAPEAKARLRELIDQAEEDGR